MSAHVGPVRAAIDTYPARPRAMSPDEEARRHWRPLREDCVCGEAIVAVTFLPQDIIDAVRRHQIEPVHIAYDLAHGIALASWQLIHTRGER